MSKNDAPAAPQKRTRYAIYTRYSSEMQNDMSLEAQEYKCRKEIAEQGGVVVQVFSDSAKSGWNLDRPGFIDLCKAAERGKFDAVMLWKLDRLARNHDHVVAIKALLRHKYGLKLHCVEGFSEDDNDSVYNSTMEQMLAVFAAFYSTNLSSETKRGKQQRARLGDFNGSTAPLGYNLVTKETATQQYPPGLYINARQAVVVRRAFRLYATGEFSDSTIAKWMNEHPLIVSLRERQLPINKEMVRDMLQNRVYTGRVRYTETIYSGSLGEKRKSKRLRSEWFEGKHKGFISDELFDACQEARAKNTKIRRLSTTFHAYILQDRVYCARCIANKPHNHIDNG